MNGPILECVPNFSEGRDLGVINDIRKSIESVPGVYIIHIDRGEGANRTVFTFMGRPEAVLEAAFRSIQKSGERINMENQTGVHPRMGATDVCPFIPLQNISLEEGVDWSIKLAERVGRELNLAIYLYEASQTNTNRKNLSTIRSGEYEGLADKILLKDWKPDFGPAIFDSKRGATVIGARNILVAYNINLNTTELAPARKIAKELRKTDLKDSKGLAYVKAIGWFIPEYGCTQVSMNLTNIDVTPLHVVFEEVSRLAEIHGLEVRGSEIIGLLPERCLLEAGRYFLRKEKKAIPQKDLDLIQAGVIYLGLDSVAPFILEDRIIEWKILAVSSTPKYLNSEE